MTRLPFPFLFLNASIHGLCIRILNIKLGVLKKYIIRISFSLLTTTRDGVDCPRIVSFFIFVVVWVCVVDIKNKEQHRNDSVEFCWLYCGYVSDIYPCKQFCSYDFFPHYHFLYHPPILLIHPALYQNQHCSETNIVLEHFRCAIKQSSQNLFCG
jgi:hypothetical protein